MKCLQSFREYDKITILQREGLSIRKITKELGRSPSIISRKLNDLKYSITAENI